MNRKIRLYAAVTLVALFVAGCSGPCDTIKPITAPTATGGRADFTTYVALGTSISAGGQSGGIVETHQACAFPALFAHQIRASAFTYDRISPDGIHPLLQLLSLTPLHISNAGLSEGFPRDFSQTTPYHNLGVYGSLIVDVTSSARYASPACSTYFRIVTRGRGSVLHEAAALAPTFVSFEYGANEVLGSALAGSGTPVLSVGSFTFVLTTTLDSLQTRLPNAKLAIFNVPEVTNIPYVRTVKPFVVVPASGDTVWLLCSEDADHPDGTLNPDDFVLLPASVSLAAGVGLPTALGGTGAPLPDSQVLTASEAASLRAAVEGYNEAISAAADLNGAALVDLHGLFARLAARGYDFQGVHYSTAFVSGGLFSLDGVHPTDFASGLIANAMIDAVNAKFGASVPVVDLQEVAHLTPLRAQPAQEEGGLTWPRVEGLDQALKAISARR
jgi:hypothetical protein